jgi:hypothetical protein
MFYHHSCYFYDDRVSIMDASGCGKIVFVLGLLMKSATRLHRHRDPQIEKLCIPKLQLKFIEPLLRAGSNEMY